MKTERKFILAAIALSMAGFAQAGAVVGDQVTCVVTGGGSFSCTPVSAVIGAGVEFGIGSSLTRFFDADFSTGLLIVNTLVESTLGSTVLNFVDLTNPFTTANFLSQTGFIGLDASDVSLNAGTLSIDLRNTSSISGATFSVALPGGGNVPEPGTLALAGAAIAGLMAARSRRIGQVR